MEEHGDGILNHKFEQAKESSSSWSMKDIEELLKDVQVCGRAINQKPRIWITIPWVKGVIRAESFEYLEELSTMYDFMATSRTIEFINRYEQWLKRVK